MSTAQPLSLRTTSEERRLGSLRVFFAQPQGRAALLGVAGALILVAGGLGAGSTRRHDPLLEAANLSWLRFGHGLVLASIFVWVGVLLMIWAWVRLGRATLRGDVPLAQLRFTVLLWTVPMLLSVPLFSRDAYSYLAQGALLRDGFDPYSVGPVVNPGVLLDNVSIVWTTTPAPYGPGFMLIAETVTRLSGDSVVIGTMLMRLAMLPGLMLTLWAVPRLARYLGGDPATAIWLAVLNPLVLIHLIGGVHNEVLMVGLMAAGLVLALQRHHVAGIAVVTAGVAVKATAGVALPFIVWIWMIHQRTDAAARDAQPAHPLVLFARCAGAGVGVFAVVLGALSALAGLGLGWLSALQGSARIVNWLSFPTILAHIVTWFTSFSLSPVLDVTRMLCGVAMLVILVVVWWRYRHTQRNAVIGILFALIAIVALSPAALPWYYSWPLAIAAGFALSPRTLVILTGLSVWLMVIFNPDGSHGMYSWIHVGLTFAVAILAAWSLRQEDPLRVREWLLGRRPTESTP
ncbi:alpha-(1-_6)-mannopyranosyltransferase A [Hoyosella sp. YIM 151337]|uniref:alpha-(1->6)-mannopyranosyltransferase A n=1 Tax=Hoyosella sp. YIM 151337 TaxID=2992742 RepID=UPI0022356AF1|nr:alpha-(1->6)-mannopyranosyltransferase A [Hoyosella sp. YIM 151337]MCW4355406.1 alpha-(1->6)-mannopyranosyltransferase A [Hoyosella sp. YIM 151337]